MVLDFLQLVFLFFLFFVWIQWTLAVRLALISEPDDPPNGRQRAVAQVRPMTVSQVVKDIAGRHPLRTVRHFDSTYMSDAGFGSPSFPTFCGFGASFFKLGTTLFCRINPAKTADDVITLQQLSH